METLQYDGQNFGTVVDPDTDLLTLADQELLNLTGARYAPNGLDTLRRDVMRLRTQLLQDPSAKDTTVRAYLADHPNQLTKEDYETIKRLRDKAKNAKAASLAVQDIHDIEYAVEKGFITESDAGRRISDARRKVTHGAFHYANTLIMQLGTLESLLNGAPEALMPDEAKREAMEAFGEYDAWENTKAAFKARYNALSSFKQKRELAQMFPALYEAMMSEV